MMPPEPLYQSDSRWHHLMLGSGPSTIGQAGCVLTCLTMAVRALGDLPGLLPPEVNKIALAKGGFIRDALLLDRSAYALGLYAPDAGVQAGKAGDILLAGCVSDALQKGYAILRVDDKGDGKGHHSILAVDYDPLGKRVTCLDPAVGRMHLSFPELDNDMVHWGANDVRHYRVVSVRPIRKLVH